MDARAIGERFARALDRRDLKHLRQLLHPDFRLVDQGLPDDLDRAAFLRWIASLEHAFPDWDMNIRDVRADGEHVHFSTRLEATHRSLLDLQEFGGGVVLPTWKRVRIAAEPVTLRLADGHVVEMRIHAVPGGGLQGILAQLGQHLPHAMDQPPRPIEMPPPLVEFQEL